MKADFGGRWKGEGGGVKIVLQFIITFSLLLYK